MDEKFKDIDREDFFLLLIMAMLPENKELVKKPIEDELTIEEACKRC